jgi:hypothetical protein
VKEKSNVLNGLIGRRSRARTCDPLIKSHQVALINQPYFDISSFRSGIEPEGKLENVETRNGAPKNWVEELYANAELAH